MSKDANYIRLINCTKWREVRAQKLSQQPTCERCRSMYGRKRAASCVHHIQPIEALPVMEMERMAYLPTNLMSLCYECHRDIHAAERSHSRKQVEVRSADRHARWREQHTLRGESRLPTARESNPGRSSKSAGAQTPKSTAKTSD